MVTLSLSPSCDCATYHRLFALSTTLLYLVLSFTLSAGHAHAVALPRSISFPSYVSPPSRRDTPHQSWTRRDNNPTQGSKRCISVQIDDEGDENWDGNGDNTLISLLTLPCVEICVEGRYDWGRCNYSDFQVWY